MDGDVILSPKDCYIGVQWRLKDARIGSAGIQCLKMVRWRDKRSLGGMDGRGRSCST